MKPPAKNSPKNMEMIPLLEIPKKGTPAVGQREQMLAMQGAPVFATEEEFLGASSGCGRGGSAQVRGQLGRKCQMQLQLGRLGRHTRSKKLGGGVCRQAQPSASLPRSLQKVCSKLPVWVGYQSNAGKDVARRARKGRGGKRGRRSVGVRAGKPHAAEVRRLWRVLNDIRRLL